MRIIETFHYSLYEFSLVVDSSASKMIIFSPFQLFIFPSNLVIHRIKPLKSHPDKHLFTIRAVPRFSGNSRELSYKPSRRSFCAVSVTFSRSQGVRFLRDLYPACGRVCVMYRHSQNDSHNPTAVFTIRDSGGLHGGHSGLGSGWWSA